MYLVHVCCILYVLHEITPAHTSAWGSPCCTRRTGCHTMPLTASLDSASQPSLADGDASGSWCDSDVGSWREGAHLHPHVRGVGRLDLRVIGLVRDVLRARCSSQTVHDARARVRFGAQCCSFSFAWHGQPSCALALRWPDARLAWWLCRPRTLQPASCRLWKGLAPDCRPHVSPDELPSPACRSLCKTAPVRA